MKGHGIKTWMLLAAVAAVVLAGPAWAQEAAKPAEPGTSEAGCERQSLTADGLEEWLAASKKPCDWLSLGADARLREIFSPNLLLDQEDRHFQRYRFRVWSTITPCENLNLNTRLVWEPRHFCQPSRTAETRDGRYIDEWTGNEAIFDKMNIEAKKIGGMPVSVKVGRQDIILGNGWLVLDGTPLDGSRTIFFDAARATVELEEVKTKVDLIYINQHADSDWWIKPFCDKDFHNMEQDEQGAIVYVTNKSLDKTQLDGYFMWKHDERDIGDHPGDIRAGNLAPWQAGTEGDIYLFGGRIAGDLGENWKYRAEFAQEFGRKDKRDLCAWGANTRLEYHFNDKYKNNLRVAYEYLSGDDPSTPGKDEGFDPLWCRWPQFSELLAYTIALEKRPGEWSNLHRVGFGWTTHPTDKLEWCNDYHLLFADEPNAYGRRPIGGHDTFADDCFRGQLFTSLLRYKFNKHIAGHLIAELFCPGDFYADYRDQTAGFFRYELTFTW